MPSQVQESHLLNSVCRFKCSPHVETPSHTHRVILDQMPGHPTIQAGWHMKSIIVALIWAYSLAVDSCSGTRAFEPIESCGLGFANGFLNLCVFISSLYSLHVSSGSRGLIRLVCDPRGEAGGDTVFLHHTSFYGVSSYQYSVHRPLVHWWLQMVIFCDLFVIYQLEYFLKICFPALLFATQ